MEKRISEIISSMTSFNKEVFNKSEYLPELLTLQRELVDVTFSDVTDRDKLRIWDVETHLEKMNAERGYIANELLKKVKNGCHIICNTIKAEMSGQAGEYKTFRSLETLRCKNAVLKNIEFKLGDHRTELDAIVITRKAAFIIEVKNPGKDVFIDERGNYCRVNNDTLCFDKNIGEKMNDKEYLLRAALSKAGFEDIDIINIVVFTNSAIHVENRYPYINTCYLSDLPHRIMKLDGEFIYSDTDIENMVAAIEASKCYEEYPMAIDISTFKKDFACLIATLEKADIKLLDFVETPKAEINHNNLKTSATSNSQKETKHQQMKAKRKYRIASGIAASFTAAFLTSVALAGGAILQKS